MNSDPISVSACIPGSEYLVDAEDGHAPYKMRLGEIRGGSYKFFDKMGGRVELKTGDKVWEVKPDPVPEVPSVEEILLDDELGVDPSAFVHDVGPSPDELATRGVQVGVHLTSVQVDLLSSLFRDRAQAIPKGTLSTEAEDLLRQLRLVD